MNRKLMKRLGFVALVTLLSANLVEAAVRDRGLKTEKVPTILHPLSSSDDGLQ